MATAKKQASAKSGQKPAKSGQQPNILVIWGDDIGISNLSCYSDGLMGYRTPNIDRLADEGMRFTDYGTGNGPHLNTWPDAGMTPFRNEKNSNWEGAFRTPCVIRWPGKIEAGTISNEIVSHMDWMPTLLAAAGEPKIKEKLRKGHKAGKKTYKVHLDGYNLVPYLIGENEHAERDGFFYFSDDGDLMALRFDNWKLIFMEQRQPGTLQIWVDPFVPLRVPKLFNLRTDPYERADITSNTYWDWMIDRIYLAIAGQKLVSDFLATFQEFPPRQKAASFTIDQIMDRMEAAIHAQ